MQDQQYSWLKGKWKDKGIPTFKMVAGGSGWDDDQMGPERRRVRDPGKCRKRREHRSQETEAKPGIRKLRSTIRVRIYNTRNDACRIVLTTPICHTLCEELMTLKDGTRQGRYCGALMLLALFTFSTTGCDKTRKHDMESLRTLLQTSWAPATRGLRPGSATDL